MVKRKKSFLEGQYFKSFNYIKDSKKYIYHIIGIFFFFVIVGYLIPAPDFIVERILEFISELIEKTEGMSQGELIGFIFLNNLQSSFFGMILGFFLGLFPIFASVTNGYLLGFVAKVTVSEEGILVLWRLLPHGIFELPAVFIALGLGLRFGTFIFKKEKYNEFRFILVNSLRVFLYVIIPLLIIAAIIEGSLITLAG